MIKKSSRAKRRTLRTIAVALLATTTIAACGGGTETSSSEKSSTESTTRVKNAAIGAPCTVGNECRVGDPGMKGGTVFYVLAQPVNCGGSIFNAQCNEWEVAPPNWAVGNLPTDTNLNRRSLCTTGTDGIDIVCKWNNGTSNVNGTLSSRLGYGLYNWMRARAIANVELTAAFNAAGYTPAGYSVDTTKSWFLPSKEELIALCNFANGSAASTTTCKPGTLKSSFAPDWYWSSSSTSNGSLVSSVWAVNFRTGEVAARTLGSTGYVRPIFGNNGAISTSTVQRAMCEGSPCRYGSIGQAKGIIVYANTTPFACGVDMKSKCNFIEITPAPASSSGSTNCRNFSTAVMCYWPDAPITTSDALGAGASNTAALFARDPNGVAGLARTSVGGATDWFLPSAVEARLVCRYMYKTLTNTEADVTTPCAASSQASKTNQYLHNFLTSSGSGDMYMTISSSFEIGDPMGLGRKLYLPGVAWFIRAF